MQHKSFTPSVVFKNFCASFITAVFMLGSNTSNAAENSQRKPAAESKAVTASAKNAYPLLDFEVTTKQLRVAYTKLLAEKFHEDRRVELAMSEITTTEGGADGDLFRTKFPGIKTSVNGLASNSTRKITSLNYVIPMKADSNVEYQVLAAVFLTRAATGISEASNIGDTIVDMYVEAAKELEEPTHNTKTRTIDGYKIAVVPILGNTLVMRITRVE